MRNPEPARCPICDVRLSRVEPDHIQKCREVAACLFCLENKDQMHPPHFASPRCESGKRNHCTCDVCF